MLMPLDTAASAFSVPPGYLLRVMNGALRSKAGVILCEFFEAAKRLHCSVEVAQAVAKGEEWLFQDFEIERLYGCNEVERRRIAKAPAFTPGVYAAVWRASPFIEWLSLSPRNRERVLEGKKTYVVKARTKNKRLEIPG